MPPDSTTVSITLDREYTIDFNLDCVDSIERHTGRSISEINESFVEARANPRSLRVGLLYKMVVGAVASVDPSFPARASKVIDSSKVQDFAAALAPAFNVAMVHIFGVADDQKKTTLEAVPPAPEPLQPSNSV